MVDVKNIILIGKLSLSEIGINLLVLCLDGVTSIVSAGEISSILASGLVFYKSTSNSGSGGNSNSFSSGSPETNRSGKTAEDIINDAAIL